MSFYKEMGAVKKGWDYVWFMGRDKSRKELPKRKPRLSRQMIEKGKEGQNEGLWGTGTGPFLVRKKDVVRWIQMG
jgi:hypothetical protein